MNLPYDERFLRALRNTLLFVVGTVPMTTVAAMGLAVLLRGRVPGKSLLKAGFFLPSIISMVVISLVFKLFYSPAGGLNNALSLVGLGGHGWLTDPAWTKPSMIFMGIWYASRPKIAGGDLDTAREHFLKAIELGKGKFLMAYVYYADQYAKKAFNRELFRSILEGVMETRTDIIPELTLLNTVAQANAKEMLDRVDEFF